MGVQRIDASIKETNFLYLAKSNPSFLSDDEFPKPETSVESLSKLRPAFVRDGTGTVTAGNASGTNIIYISNEILFNFRYYFVCQYFLYSFLA